MARQSKNLSEIQKEAVKRAVKRAASKTDTSYWTEFLTELVLNNSIPAELLENIPLKAGKIGKTRFDQLYAASMFLIFPGYREKTLKQLLGPKAEINSNTKIWKAIFPIKFGLAHILIRADSFQEAFAFACDYACRASLRIFKKIPTDLTVRIRFVSEIGIRRRLQLSQANKILKQKNLRLEAREFTPKQINGARLFALGIYGTEKYAIAKYTEIQDLRWIRARKNMQRISSIEYEAHRK